MNVIGRTFTDNFSTSLNIFKVKIENFCNNRFLLLSLFYPLWVKKTTFFWHWLKTHFVMILYPSSLRLVGILCMALDCGTRKVKPIHILVLWNKWFPAEYVYTVKTIRFPWKYNCSFARQSLLKDIEITTEKVTREKNKTSIN